MNVMRLLLKKYRRKVNKVIKGGGILSILFALMISLFIPPFNIFADTLTMTNIVGVNYTVSSSDVVGTVTFNNQSYNRYSVYYDVEIQLDDSYLGWCQLTLEYDWFDRDSSGIVDKNNNVTRRVYINGNSVHINLNIVNNYGTNPLKLLYNNPRVTTITNSDVTLYGDLSTLLDIYNILLDVQQNVSDSEDLLRDISMIRQYNIPFESFNFVHYMFHMFDIVDIANYYNYQYPIFSIDTNDVIFKLFAYRSRTYKVIFYFNQNLTYDNRFLNNFVASAGSMTNVEYTPPSFESSNRYGAFYSFDFTVPSSQEVTFTFTNVSNMSRSEIIPIYFGYKDNKNVTTDFALLWGLSNQLIDDLHIISSGTNQSNTSSSNLESQKGSFDTTSNDLYSSENAFNTDMNNKLQSIDTSFNPSTSFGSKFLSSANWVRTQFDNLTSTSPFGTVLSFSMLLGLSLLIIGKVFK